MPVFISHRTADDHLAQQVHDRLTYTHGIKCYIDDIDHQLLGLSERELTKRLVDTVNKCSNLLAVVTVNTRSSWWIPYEVGVAKQAPRIITSMTNLQDQDLPEYLIEWPRLRGNQAIDDYAAMYKAQQRAILENVMKKTASAASSLSTVDRFHRQLKAQLGQR